MEYKSDQVKNKKSIALNSLRVRFVLEIETNSKKNKSILVVMKNPSQANEHQSDKTVNNVIENLHTDYRNIYIVNLYPYYSTKAVGLLSCFESEDIDVILEINDKYIADYADKASEFLIGWGTNTIGMKEKDYENRVKKVLGMLNSKRKPIYYVHCCKCENNPAGCGNNSLCGYRCKKKCHRNNGYDQKCGDVRFPMHLELWENGKKQIKYR